MSLANMRRDYRAKPLVEQEVDRDALKQFAIWFDEATKADLPDANAMTLSTATKDGKPSARIVLLKGITETGIKFYTNYNSIKGRQLADNPFAAVTIFWGDLDRQVRMEGKVSRVSREDSDAYFHSRPRGSQVSAFVSEQSEVIADRDVLEQQAADVEKQYGGKDIPLPDDWGGYELVPDMIEFWHGRPSRLHDRLRYTRTESGWQIDRLAP